jgi:TIR domain
MLDIQFEVGGRRVNARDLGEALDDMLFTAVAENLHTQLSGVRDPDTGEFPVIAIRGHDLSNLSFEISGSEQVVNLAKQRLGIDENGTDAMTDQTSKPIKVFLSHASEDKQLARRIAEHLTENGIDTFFDEWEIRPGDSIRQRIDQGLDECSHFIILATETSIEKEWVKSEIDGVYRRKIEGQCRLIPLRYRLEARRLPASLGSLHAPALDDFDVDMTALVHSIYDISKKPALGSPPEIIAQKRSEGRIGVSTGAEALVRLCMEKTEHGDSHDPQLDKEAIASNTGLGKNDIIDAVEELEASGLVKHIRFLGDGGIGYVAPTASLYVKFDNHFNNWNPEQDALKVAAALVNDVCDGNTVKLAEHFGWQPRRTNPALAYLVERKLVDASQSMGTHPWNYAWVQSNSKTRRFVRDRS